MGGNTGEEIITPKVLAIPNGAFGDTLPKCTGTITLSGGILYYMSGATLAIIKAVAA